MKWIVLAAALIPATCICQSVTTGAMSRVAPTGPSPADADMVHEGSGMHFPKRIGDFMRTRAMRFDEAGTDVAATYHLNEDSLSITATAYIYPGREADREESAPTLDALARNMLCTQELDKRTRELAGAHPNSVIGAPVVTTLAQAGSEHTGYRISFNDYEDYGGTPQNVGAEFYLFCFAKDDWTIAYRFSYPAKSAVREQITRFMRELDWPQ